MPDRSPDRTAATDLSDGLWGPPSLVDRERRCPDGSWSKWLSRRCVLPYMHTGPHRYEMRVIQPRKAKP